VTRLHQQIAACGIETCLSPMNHH